MVRLPRQGRGDKATPGGEEGPGGVEGDEGDDEEKAGAAVQPAV